MTIEYKHTKEFTSSQLQRLFLSVNWESGKYPDKLVRAMHNSTRVISAWDGDKLIGIPINSLPTALFFPLKQDSPKEALITTCAILTCYTYFLPTKIVEPDSAIHTDSHFVI